MTVYATAVVLENGEVLFFDDIYGEDIRLERSWRKDRYGNETEREPHADSSSSKCQPEFGNAMPSRVRFCLTLCGVFSISRSGLASSILIRNSNS